ncbi:MAG: flagellar basal body L-ring protein FlgH [Acidobacteriaceae bacterium]
MKRIWRGMGWWVLLVLVAGAPAAQAWGHKHKKQPRETPPDMALDQYIQQVTAEARLETRTPGSIWSDEGRLTRIYTDVRAMHVHDPISVVVSESLAASTDGTVKDSRSSSANSQVASLLGKLAASNALNNLVNQSSGSSLSAQGQSVTDSSLSTVFGGEVEAILPNGMMVIQAVRQLTFSQQTQLIKLRGLIRPEDINAQNQVLSTNISDLEIEVTGKGIVNDATYRQNPVVRWLERILVF